jgi:hypothetical protein
MGDLGLILKPQWITLVVDHFPMRTAIEGLQITPRAVSARSEPAYPGGLDQGALEKRPWIVRLRFY